MTPLREIREKFKSEETVIQIFEIIYKSQNRRRMDPRQFFRAKQASDDASEIFKSLKFDDFIFHLKYFSGFGLGSFQNDRFVWNYDPKDLAAYILGKSDRIAKVDDLASDASAEEIEHSFQLRTDFKVKLTLPSDLSANEVKRLVGFLNLLPVEE